MTEITLEVLAERIGNFDKSNSEAHKDICKKLQENINFLSKLSKDHERRIKKLEFWKVGFVAKFSVYSGIALFLGSVIAQLLIKFLSKYL